MTQPKEWLASPEDAGMSGPALARLDDVMEDAMGRGWVPGAVTLVARGGRIVQYKAYGKADESRGMERDMLFRWASMSKTIGGAAVMQLMDRGIVALGDPVTLYLPEFAGQKVMVESPQNGVALAEKAREITVHDLLTMTSGMARIDAFEDALAALYGEKLRQFGFIDTMLPLGKTLAEVVACIAQVPLAAQPGQKWYYSNAGVLTLSRIVEVASGQPLGRFLQENLFGPLAMEDTHFYAPKEKWGRFPAAYNTNSNKPYNGLVETGMDDANLAFSPVQTFENIAGGLMGTAYDYFRFAQMLANGGALDGTRVLSAQTVDQMTRNQMDPGGDFFVKQGWGYMGGVMIKNAPTGNKMDIGSYGWGGYWGTDYAVDRRRGLVAVFMTQVFPDTSARLRERFFAVAGAAALEGE